MNFTVANGWTAAECYALGLDPADATNDFRIVSIEMVGGEWKSVEGATATEKAAMRFFKVVVEVQ